jgi:hypothetical protein
MMILLRDVNGNELELSHGSAVCMKDARSGKEVNLAWPELPKLLQHELDDLASRAVRTMEQARELITPSSGRC